MNESLLNEHFNDHSLNLNKVPDKLAEQLKSKKITYKEFLEIARRYN